MTDRQQVAKAMTTKYPKSHHVETLRALVVRSKRVLRRIDSLFALFSDGNCGPAVGGSMAAEVSDLLAMMEDVPDQEAGHGKQ